MSRQWIENQPGKLKKNLKTDNGGNFDIQDMREYCIEYETIIPYTSLQNAFAEKRIGIITTTLALFYSTADFLPILGILKCTCSHFEIESLETESPRRTTQKKTSFPPAHRELGKLDARAELTTFLGPEEKTSNCLLVERDSGTFFRARDVRFVEILEQCTRCN